MYCPLFQPFIFILPFLKFSFNYSRPWMSDLLFCSNLILKTMSTLLFYILYVAGAGCLSLSLSLHFPLFLCPFFYCLSLPLPLLLSLTHFFEICAHIFSNTTVSCKPDSADHHLTRSTTFRKSDILFPFLY